jgi:hypothetical protein
MNRYLLTCFLMVFICGYTYGDLDKEIPESAQKIHFTLNDSNIVPQNLEKIKNLAGKAKEQDSLSVKDISDLKSSITMLIQDKFMEISAAERQKLVRNTIGEDTYSIFEKMCLKMLSSNNAVQQSSALVFLGFPLFDLNVSEEIKKFVFNKNKEIQLTAIESLVYLDIKGADFLLCNLSLSGILPDYQQASVIDALYRTNNKDLPIIAPTLLTRDIGGGAFKSLLPVLKKRDDYNTIAAGVFKSSMFNVPDKEKLTIEEHAKVSALHSILEDIFENISVYMADVDVKKKVIMYANAKYNRLNKMSLLILEKSGQDKDYFSKMLKDDNLTDEKKQTLENVINRIQKGERLK